nr:callose synthase 7-like [Tanacetum cinerariifolium]
MDINKMMDTLEPKETGVRGLQLPGKDRVIFRPSERKSLLKDWVRKNIAKFSQVERIHIFTPDERLDQKIPIALDMAKDFKGKEDADLFRKINSDDYMRSSVTECCQTVRDILFGLLNDERDNMILQHIFHEVETCIEQRTCLSKFRVSELPSLNDKLVKFLEHLDIMEIITQHVMINGHEGIEMEQKNIQDRSVLSIDYHRPFIQVTTVSIEFLESSMPMRQTRLKRIKMINGDAWTKDSIFILEWVKIRRNNGIREIRNKDPYNICQKRGMIILNWNYRITVRANIIQRSCSKRLRS